MSRISSYPSGPMNDNQRFDVGRMYNYAPTPRTRQAVTPMMGQSAPPDDETTATNDGRGTNNASPIVQQTYAMSRLDGQIAGEQDPQRKADLQAQRDALRQATDAGQPVAQYQHQQTQNNIGNAYATDPQAFAPTPKGAAAKTDPGAMAQYRLQAGALATEWHNAQKIVDAMAVTPNVPPEKLKAAQDAAAAAKQTFDDHVGKPPGSQEAAPAPTTQQSSGGQNLVPVQMTPVTMSNGAQIPVPIPLSPTPTAPPPSIQDLAHIQNQAATRADHNLTPQELETVKAHFGGDAEKTRQYLHSEGEEGRSADSQNAGPATINGVLQTPEVQAANRQQATARFAADDAAKAKASPFTPENMARGHAFAAAHNYSAAPESDLAQANNPKAYMAGADGQMHFAPGASPAARSAGQAEADKGGPNDATQQPFRDRAAQIAQRDKDEQMANLGHSADRLVANLTNAARPLNQRYGYAPTPTPQAATPPPPATSQPGPVPQAPAAPLPAPQGPFSNPAYNAYQAGKMMNAPMAPTPTGPVAGPPAKPRLSILGTNPDGTVNFSDGIKRKKIPGGYAPV